MPLFTPSRIVLVVLSLTLMSFLWTWGLPHQFASPSLPVITHDKPKEVPLGEPLIPGPIITPEPSSPSRAGQGDNPAAPDPAATGQAGTPTTLRTEAISGTAATESPSGTPITGPFCKHVHGAPNVMVIVRTSKAEIQDKLPTHLKTLLSCVPNFAIFSDHSDNIDGFTVHDALANISNTTKQVHDEFREYDRIQAEADYQPNVDKTKALDKWKFLPMAYKAYKMQPNHKFYVFLEADTSLSWTNMLQWIDRLDYRIPIYGGAPMFQGDVKYAQRGPGILLSYGALRQYAKTYEERYASEWESHVGKECCGDIMLANAMIESHVEFYSAFPLIQGETPSTLDWTRGHWCSPIVTWHHMSAQDLDRLWTVHQNWTHKYGWEVPYLTRNAFHEFALPHFADKIEDWDNISSDTHIKAEQGRREKLAKEKEAEEEKKKEIPKPKEPTPEDTHTEPPNPAKPNFKPPEGPNRNVRRENIEWDKIAETIKDAADSAENCQAVCQKTDDCLQWKYTPKGDGECHLGKVMRLGGNVEKKEGQDQWTSGWIMDRIKRVTEQWGECEKPNWRFNQ